MTPDCRCVVVESVTAENRAARGPDRIDQLRFRRRGGFRSGWGAERPHNHSLSVHRPERVSVPLHQIGVHPCLTLH
jgi:hypothetical protein